MQAKRKKRNVRRPVVGWRELAALPELGVDEIKVKVDTGARTSALHAFDTLSFDRDGEEWVRFSIHPVPRSRDFSIPAEARVSAWRTVTSSNGASDRRPVIRTTLRMAGSEWPIDLTLADRDQMGFRMLLGREAIRRRFQVDPGRSYLARRLAAKKEAP